MTSTLWRALDEIPDATTDLRDWREVLGVEFSNCLRFLRSTGSLAQGDRLSIAWGRWLSGCPRRVVRLEDGRFRAVCGQKPAECDSLNLSRPDIALFSIDRLKLGAAIARAFRADGPISNRGDWIMLGRHAVSAHAGIDMVFLLPRGSDRLGLLARDLDDRKGAVIIVPATNSLSEADALSLTDRGSLVVPLAHVASIDGAGEMQLDLDLSVLLSPIRERFLAREREKRASGFCRQGHAGKSSSSS
jgi:hypothetical protein